jgi:probable HAF family extracellular repeat protein
MRLTSCIVCLILFGARVACSQNSYTIQDLGAANRSVIEVSFNDSAQVAVSLSSEEPISGPQLKGEAFLVDGGVSTSLGSIGGSLRANDINSIGTVVGAGEAADGYSHSVLFAAGHLTDLGSIGPHGSTANAINNGGDIVGEEFFDASSQAFTRLSNGVVISLGTLGGSHSYAYDISTAGIVVGGSQTITEQNPVAFAYANHAMASLGTLGGVESIAYSINDSDQIVGFSDTSDGHAHATLFSLTGSPLDLAPNHQASIALDINGQGEIVGYIDDSNGSPRAALFSLTQPPALLQDLIPTNSGWTFLFHATAINDRGQIVGTGIFGGQPGFRAFLMTPIPEPSPLDQIVCASAVLALLAPWRRFRAC